MNNSEWTHKMSSGAASQGNVSRLLAANDADALGRAPKRTITRIGVRSDVATRSYHSAEEIDKFLFNSARKVRPWRRRKPKTSRRRRTM